MSTASEAPRRADRTSDVAIRAGSSARYNAPEEHLAGNHRQHNRTSVLDEYKLSLDES
ncbi:MULTISPECIES: hypothetical protein [unclassified Streptomyces]|uniref:hypothetical protein n=1 Tax=unclassified Streptomyces TaxID=2593676 RepID=UPI002DD81A10|nr:MULTISPECIES: hypothetical protein [unclassified Streptomyces]WSS46768.1 hypothetical protein OG220_40035 [Streptomyces sp. NBC_01187]WSA97713.1 hypothetical protein OIE63_40175 [Streptomyces sp. NBC_01795]WSB82035.1 hypothetical protein OHB04_40635 [Streptomyces sp. NBC_01775]WSS18009.1 hypothetical protein OG533_39720 [Streptomyces sp. NBC_01186]WSS47015.1 hypothetical protein OG220_41590 [Streptomyces sp. NBC_01187]